MLDRNAYCVWWFGPQWYQTVYDILTEVGFDVDRIPGIWYKVNSSSGATLHPNIYLARSYEPFFICRRGTPALRKRGRSNIFAFKTVSASSKIHPTERPIELIEEILDTFVYPQAKVVIPFLGSGNTLLACYRKGLSGFGYDLTDKIKPHFLFRVQAMFEAAKLEEELIDLDNSDE